MKIGIELELNITDYRAFFKSLLDNDIDFDFSPKASTVDLTRLLIKPEVTIDGIELNIPPDYDYKELARVLGIIKPYVYFTERAALHVHISDPNINEQTLDSINAFYKTHENKIIEEAKKQDMYVDLNTSNNIANSTEVKNIDSTKYRNFNLNVYRAWKAHRTVEHRIYKATLDYNKIMWCVMQSIQIISEWLITEDLTDVQV